MSDPTIEQTYALATAHHEAGRLREADALYRQIIEADPSHLRALNSLAVLAHQVGRNHVAVQLLCRIIELSPHDADAHNNLGVALAAAGAVEQSIDSYRAALSLRPGDARANNNLGTALREAGRFQEAVAAYARAVAIAPEFAEAHDNLGLAFQENGQLADAIACFGRALKIEPRSSPFCEHLAAALRDRGDLDGSIAAARRGLELDPTSESALNTLGSSLKDSGELDEAIASYRRAIELSGNSAVIDGLLFAVHLHPAYDPRRIWEEHARWAAKLNERVPSHRNEPAPDRPLRIGYVSPDFRQHVVGYNLLPLFERHDRQRFKIFCYSNAPRADDLTARFRLLAEQWRQINVLSDARVAEMVAADGIDILVDLALHTSGNRLGVFALKPAPVQATFAGYPGTTGLKTIDYRLTDPYLDPPGRSDEFYSERSFRLPDSFWCYRPTSQEPAVSDLPALSSGFVTFGYLGAFGKVNEVVLDLWAKVLVAMPNSRLLVMCRPGLARDRTTGFLQGRGVDRGRVMFVDYQPRDPYLRTYHRIDIVLDSFPYNGHTTGLDALWMGVPVVSLVGQTPVSRAGLSQLSNAGIGDLATEDPAKFVRIATSLAEDLPRLASLRASLRTRMEQSALMDAGRFAAGIESAYRVMWRRWCQARIG